MTRNPQDTIGVDKIPVWMARKYGSERFLSGEEALDCAVSRAPSLAPELTAETQAPVTGEQKMKRAQWSSGRQLPTMEYDEGSRNKSWHWDKCALSLDFKMVDFTDLADNTRKLFYMQDDWLYQDEVSPGMTDQLDSSILNRKAIDEWWATYAPQLNEKLTPRIKDTMDSSYNNVMPMVKLFTQALQQMIDGGSMEQKSLAILALGESKTRTSDRAGNVAIPMITFGPRMKGLEFETQEVSFGSLHFVAVDMGGR